LWFFHGGSFGVRAKEIRILVWLLFWHFGLVWAEVLPSIGKHVFLVMAKEFTLSLLN
jgi:hypothetical protein